MVLDFDFEEEMPIIIEGKDVEEGNESFIDRMFNEINEGMKEPQGNINISSKKNNDYLHELLVCYKERIVFLEKEVHQKNCVIDKLLQSFHETNTHKQENTQPHSNEKFFVQKSDDCRNDFNEFGNCEINTLNSGITIRKKKINNESNKKHERRKVTQIIGDSIIKELKGWDLSNEQNQVVVKSFSGATTECMKSYSIPTKNKNPDTIILHCGTNDIPKKTKEEITDDIVNLAVSLKTEHNNVIVSSVTTRGDKHGNKVNQLNDALEEACSERNIGFINNNNITINHLNRSKLHLNPSGSKLLSDNLSCYING